jgi:hypothetical protein
MHVCTASSRWVYTIRPRWHLHAIINDPPNPIHKFSWFVTDCHFNLVIKVICHFVVYRAHTWFATRCFLEVWWRAVSQNAFLKWLRRSSEPLRLSYLQKRRGCALYSLNTAFHSLYRTSSRPMHWLHTVIHKGGNWHMVIWQVKHR